MLAHLHPALAQAAHCQSRAARQLGGLCSVWLLLICGGVLLSLHHSGVWLDAGALAIVALPVLAGLALACQRRSDARRYALHLLAATLMLPLLLLCWAGSVGGSPPPTMPDARSLDAQSLFSGAIAVEDAEMRGGALLQLRSGRFADGSELRLSRFADAQAARDYLAMLTQAMPSEPVTAGGRRALRLTGPGVGTLVLIEQHGSSLLELRAADTDAAQARLAAQRVPMPLDDAAPATTEPPARWPGLAALALAHALAFVALIAWASRHLTRLPALLGAPFAKADALRDRLLSLAQPTGPFNIMATDDASTLRVDVSPSLRRRHHIALRLDAARGRVLVHESLGIDGDAPQDADEASLRGMGDAVVDATRPDAQQLWSSTLQATMVRPERLAAVPLRLRPNQAGLPPAYAAALDGEGVLTALCAVVTRSGWHWQPQLLKRHF